MKEKKIATTTRRITKKVCFFRNNRQLKCISSASFSFLIIIDKLIIVLANREKKNVKLL